MKRIVKKSAFSTWPKYQRNLYALKNYFIRLGYQSHIGKLVPSAKSVWSFDFKFWPPYLRVHAGRFLIILDGED